MKSCLSISLVLMLTMGTVFADDNKYGERDPLQDFDRELRIALSEQNPTATAVLTRFPFRVNYPDGSSILLTNAQALITRFAEIFPPKVRSAILDQKEPKVMGEKGVMYGRGVLWVKKMWQTPYSEQSEAVKILTYGIDVVNLPDKGTEIKNRSSMLEFTCNTMKHRVVIDSDATGKVRYRSWNKPHFVTDKPDMDISPGVRDILGTAPCSIYQWKFRKGDAEFVVEECGLCGCGLSDARGTLEVSVAGKLQQTWWCY